MKNLLILFIILMGGYISAAQSLVVTDFKDNQPLASVSIYSPDLNFGTFTNQNGTADVSAFRGAATIRISSVGYITQTFSFERLEALGFQVSLRESTVALGQVVISASKWQQSSREVPNKFTTIRPTEVRFQNPQTAADMLEISGMVFIQKSQLGGGSPMIRGFATNRVLLVVDGIRMNNAIFRSGNLQNVISLDPFAIENTEVIFGPGSTIYGSDAIGGVMSFFTLNPTFSGKDKAVIGGSTTTRYSSANNEKTGHVDINIGWKKWALLSSITYSDYDDLIMGTRGPEEYLRPFFAARINNRDTILTNPNPRRQHPSGYNQTNLMQKVRFAPNSNWDITYAFHYSETSPYPRYDRLIRPRGNGLWSAEWEYGPQVWMMNNLQANYIKPTKWFDQATLRLTHQHFEESRIDRNFGSARRRIRKETVESFAINLDMEKHVADRSRLFYGIEAVTNLVGSVGEDININTGAVMPASTRYPDGSDWTSFAAYTSYQYRATDKLNLQFSGRYNQVVLNSTFDREFFPFPFEEAQINAGALTGSIGGVYNPSSSLQISSNLATGFRAPNVDDIGKVFDSSPGMVIIPNPDLGPEYSTNLDVAIAKSFGGFLKVDVTGFYNMLNNALVRRDFQLNGQDSIMYDGSLSRVQAVQNVAYARVAGLQFGLEAELPSGWRISSRYNIQKGREELDDETEAPLRHAPPSFGVTRVGYERKTWRAEIYAMYNGAITNDRLAPEEQGKVYMYAIDKNGLPWSPSWWTLNLKAQYQVKSNITLYAGLENIFNERYRPYSSGIVAPGRNAIISVRVAF